MHFVHNSSTAYEFVPRQFCIPLIVSNCAHQVNKVNYRWFVSKRGNFLYDKIARCNHWSKRNLTTFSKRHTISMYASLIAIDIRYLTASMSTDFSRDRVKFRHSLFKFVNYKWSEMLPEPLAKRMLFNWCIKKTKYNEHFVHIITFVFRSTR